MRSHGEGTLFPVTLKSGRKVYRAAVSLPDGRRRQKQAATRAAAKEALREMLDDLEAGRIGSSMSLGRYLAIWLSSVQTRLAPQGWDQHRSIIEGHLVPALGHIALSKLSVADVRTYLDTPRNWAPRVGAKRTTAGRLIAPRTMAHHRATLRRALADAQRDGLVSRNVAALAEPPRVARREAVWLDAAQMGRLFDSTKADRLHALWVLAGTTGADTIAATHGLPQGALAPFVVGMSRRRRSFVMKRASTIVADMEAKAKASESSPMGMTYAGEDLADLRDPATGTVSYQRLRDLASGGAIRLASGQELPGPAPAEKGTPGNFEDFLTADPARRREIAAARRAYAESGREPDKPPPDKQLTPTMEAAVLNRLTNQWTAATKPIRDLREQVSRMEAGMEAARRNDLAAGSQAVLVVFQKILDPTSVVRESEYARSGAGQSLINRIRGAAERLARGGAGVPLAELEAFARLARDMVVRSGGSYVAGVQARLGRTADHYGIPRDLIFEDLPSEPENVIPSASADDENPFRRPAGGSR